MEGIGAAVQLKKLAGSLCRTFRTNASTMPHQLTQRAGGPRTEELKHRRSLLMLPRVPWDTSNPFLSQMAPLGDQGGKCRSFHTTRLYTLVDRSKIRCAYGTILIGFNEGRARGQYPKKSLIPRRPRRPGSAPRYAETKMKAVCHR